MAEEKDKKQKGGKPAGHKPSEAEIAARKAAKKAKQTEETARIEIAESRARIENELQRPVLHMAYPYGDRAAASQREFVLAAASGYKTAVTTRPGMIFAESADYLTALSRVSLNGHYQDARRTPIVPAHRPPSCPPSTRALRKGGAVILPDTGWSPGAPLPISSVSAIATTSCRICFGAQQLHGV